MPEWKELTPLVQAHAPNVGVPVMIDALRRAAVKFCRSTRVYREDLDRFAVRADKSSYDVITPPGTLLIVPVLVQYDDVDIRATTEDKMPANWRNRTSGTPTRYLFLNPGVITLFPTPAEDLARAVFIRAALQPTLTSSTFPTSLYDRYAQTIAYGALSRLMMMPGKPWTDQASAQYFKGEYDADVADARIDLNRSSTESEVTINFTPLA